MQVAERTEDEATVTLTKRVASVCRGPWVEGRPASWLPSLRQIWAPTACRAPLQPRRAACRKEPAGAGQAAGADGGARVDRKLSLGSSEQVLPPLTLTPPRRESYSALVVDGETEAQAKGNLPGAPGQEVAELEHGTVWCYRPSSGVLPAFPEVESWGTGSREVLPA